MESVLREGGGAEEYIRSQGILTKQMVYNQVSGVFRTNRGVGLESFYGGISSGPGGSHPCVLCFNRNCTNLQMQEKKRRGFRCLLCPNSFFCR